MSNYQLSVIAPHNTITEAVEAIDKGGIRLALVLDDDSQLLGIVTDGDIRRALLSKLDFDLPVENIMNPKPIVVSTSATSSEMISIMRAHSILHLPVVDQQNRIVTIETLDKLATFKAKKATPVFLMAGGFGTRLRPLTETVPKVMLKVGSRPILETIMMGFIDHGFSEFYISVFYLADQIRNYFGDGSKWGVNIYYVEEQQPLGTGGALSLLPEEINEPIIMMNGDLLTNVNFNSLLNYHNSKQSMATMCVREYTMEVPYGVIEADNMQITSIVEKPKQHFFVNAGIYVLSPEVFKAIPKSHRQDMPDIFNSLIRMQKNVMMYPVHEYWLDIGRLGDFEQAQNDVLDMFSQ
jgi:dTDP-glucose pyrophosphorylase